MESVCLLGNGVSMAYNPALGVGPLTADLIDLFRRAGVSAPEQALGEFARSLGSGTGEQFEDLLGPISSTSEALRFLPAMAAITSSGPDNVTAALEVVVSFLGEIHRTGLAITLDHIAHRSVGGNFDGGAWPVASALIGLGEAKDLTVATLNYDGLLHAGMMGPGWDGWHEVLFQIADLADGRHAETFEVVPGINLTGHPLRDVDDLPRDRASLLQMHGSLGWLRNPANRSEVWRFELGKLREIDYWEAWRRGKTQWEPVVVLTDRKEKATATWPFSLAYDTLLHRLVTAGRWLVAGYGLGDLPVNLLFRAAGYERRRQRLEPTPPTLIIGVDSSSDELAERAAKELGMARGVVTATNVGVPAAFNTPEWKSWVSLSS